MAQDYYATLGVGRDASQAEIQKAYRDLARKHHPDMNPDDDNAKKRFQEIQAAFDVLNNPEKRELYDRYGSSFDKMGGGDAGGSYGQWGPEAGSAGGFRFEDVDLGDLFGDRFSGASGGGGFHDIFEQFRQAGGRSQSRATPRSPGGADLAYKLNIAFNTSITGGEAQISVRRQSGKVETLAVKIPAGIESGKKIRLRGQGEPGARGGQAGDILLTIHVAPHPCFHRQGDNLHVRVPVTLAEATLGAKVDLPTPKGTVSLRIPPETSSGTKLRVKGHGIAARGNKPATDLLAEVQIVLPKPMEDATRKLIEEIGKLNSKQEPRAKLHW